ALDALDVGAGDLDLDVGLRDLAGWIGRARRALRERAGRRDEHSPAHAEAQRERDLPLAEIHGATPESIDRSTGVHPQSHCIDASAPRRAGATKRPPASTGARP